MMESKRYIVLSGPSGVGKSTVIKSLRQRLPHLEFAVSATTRLPREDEQEGVDYHFCTEEEFRDLNLLEQSCGGSGDYYGTPWFEILKERSGNVLVCDMDTRGGFAMKRAFGSKVTLIFLVPSSAEVLRERLLGRGTESVRQIVKRLNNAKKQLEDGKRYDYMIINEDVEDTLTRLLSIMESESLRMERNLFHMDDLLHQLQENL